jgi:7-keto-8-aminopelargonate synthetase-like enzyme
MEQLLQERIHKTLQALAVATSELEVYRNQGRVASLQELLNLKEQLRKIK